MPQKKNNSNNSKKPQNAYFLSLELENIRCFGEKQKIDFSDGKSIPKQWTIILGDNGTGKTTILQTLVGMIPTKIEPKGEGFPFRKAIIPNIYALNFNSDGIFLNSLLINEFDLKNPEKINLSKKNKYKDFSLTTTISPQIRLNAISERKIWMQVQETGIKSNCADEALVELNLSCFAYGAGRKSGEASLSKIEEIFRYSTLFYENAQLINPEEWLLQADYASKRKSKFTVKRKRGLELVKKILIGDPPEMKGALPEIDGIRFSESESGRTPKPIVEFHTPYGWVESKDLSLGYRTSMAWMVDFASRMFDLYPESENPLAEPSVVLIDEIDLHLHPKWQRELLDYLSNLFPNTQFIVTTHSPLIVQSAAARDANIVVCRREGDHVVIDQSVEAVKNWRADQILTSDLFGLETSRPKEIEKDLLERQAILSKAKLTKKDEKRLTELEEKIGSVPVMENPKYDEAMDIIFRAAEKLEKKNDNPK